MSRVVVIGIGNRWRGDDGVGPRVLDAVAPRLPSDVEVRELDGEPARLVEAWDGADLVVVVDAERSDDPPGTRHRFEVDGREPAGLTYQPAGVGSHTLGLRDAIELGAVLGRLPQRLIVHAITGSDFTVGGSLDPAVESAAARVADEVIALVRAPDRPRHARRVEP